jgi:hypothetical protein
MTAIQSGHVQCACCREHSAQALPPASNEFGARDLDHRPPETVRSTMESWLQECPHCGYVAADLGQAEDSDRKMVRTDRYQVLRHGPYVSRLSGRFLLRAVLDSLGGKRERAFASTLCAAWDADDRDLKDAARSLRKRAANYLRGHDEDSVELKFRLLDVHRRASDWKRADLMARHLAEQTLDPQMSAILAFQARRIHAKDDAAYTVAHALSGDLGAEHRLRILR